MSKTNIERYDSRRTARRRVSELQQQGERPVVRQSSRGWIVRVGKGS